MTAIGVLAGPVWSAQIQPLTQQAACLSLAPASQGGPMPIGDVAILRPDFAADRVDEGRGVPGGAQQDPGAKLGSDGAGDEGFRPDGLVGAVVVQVADDTDDFKGGVFVQRGGGGRRGVGRRIGAGRQKLKFHQLADRLDHHPDIILSYRTVRLELSTHADGGLTEDDFALAAEVNALLIDR